MRALVLPGMDGTGALLREFSDALAPDIEADVVAYPPDMPAGYAGLEAFAHERLPRSGPFVLIGESFSGPLAIRLAATAPPGLSGLALCASFASSPRPELAALRGLLHLPLPKPPLPLLMPFMMGRWTTREWTRRERAALSRMPARVARARLAEVMRVDVRDALVRVRCPVLYLQASHDRLVPPRCAREVARRAPQTTVVTLEGPHFILQHQPQACAQAIRD